MKKPQERLSYYWLLVFWITLFGVIISFTPSITFATNIDIPKIDDSFFKPKEFQNNEPPDEITNEESIIKDHFNFWEMGKTFLESIQNITEEIEPFFTNSPFFNEESGQWIDPASPKGLLKSLLIDFPRSVLGNIFLKDGTVASMIIDGWETTEEGINLYNLFKSWTSGEMVTVSKFSKGAGYFGILISISDLVYNIFNATDGFNSGDTNKGWDSFFNGLGNIGEILIARGAMSVPTPASVAATIIGTFLWCGSVVWNHRETIISWFNGAVSWIGDRWKGFTSWAGNTWSMIWSEVSSWPGKIWSGLTNLGNKIWNGMTNLGGYIWKGATAAWNNFTDLAKDTMDAAKDLAVDAWNGLKNGAKKLWKSIFK